MKRIFYFFLFTLLVGASSLWGQTETTYETLSLAQKAERVTIIRDGFGVPHIYGKTDADAVFGLLYAQCEDDFNRVEQNYIWATGRLAEVEGEEALYSDLRAKLFMTEAEAKVYYEESPEWLKKLCNAFADGVNYYLETHREVQPRLITNFEPWMPMYFSEGSIGGDIERISTQKLQAFYESGKEVPKMELMEQKKAKELEEPQGSNGIAIAGSLTGSGDAMLLINPHTSFFFRGEVHVVSEEGLNAYGAVTWGQFFVYQGFNEKTGWMHTSSYTDVMDEFKETVISQQGRLLYHYGEEFREVGVSEITLKYSTPEGIKDITFTGYRTHHGPITHAVDGQWTASAMMWSPAKALEQSFVRTKQEDYAGFRQMMDIRTNSSNNTVYADADGTIAYFHGNFVPKRDVRFDYALPVDGSNPKTDWQGLHTVDENILVLNPKNGWIQNCNSTPFTAALDYSPKKEDYPYYMSRDEENFRGVHAIMLLKEVNKITLDGLITLAHDPYLPAFEALIPGLLTAYKKVKPTDAEVKKALKVLQDWDYKTDAESVAMTLAHYYGTQYFKDGAYTDGMSAMERVQFWGSAAPEEEKRQIFEQIIAGLTTDFGTWNMPWGDVNRYQRTTGAVRQEFDDTKPSMPIGFASGTWGALAAYGARYTTEGAKKIYGTRGNSFVAAVEFGDTVKAKTILAGGQSGDPSSPHFKDQIQPYAAMQWKDALFYKTDVLKNAKETYRPGKRK